MEAVQRAFDRVLPARGVETPPPEAPRPPEQQPVPPTPPEVPPEPKKPEEFTIPTFLEEALSPKPPETTPPPAAPDLDTEWPEDLPQEERKSRVKGLREAYKRVKGELEQAQKRPTGDPQERQRLTYLEQQNRQMAEMLSRVGVEHSQEFQREIIQPLTASWREATKIVADSGADPNELAKAMTLSGKAQFEALDSLFADMPESAKMEAHDALRTYRRYEEARQRAIANAPRTLEQLRARETERQYQEVTKQKEGMSQMFDRALAKLRDEARVEVFQTSSDPTAKWWNDQNEHIVNQARNLFLENTDMEKVAFACLLAPAADTYRKLFLTSQKKVGELQKIINERIGNEPNLSESSGNASHLMPEAQLQEDLKKPFTDVFLREFHKAQQGQRR